MSNLIIHAERELKLAGLFDKDSDYKGALGGAVMELVKVYAKQAHSGASASMVRGLFVQVANFENLTPITPDPEEWQNVAGMSGVPMWQNKRNPAYFSDDGGKTCWHVDEKNKERKTLDKSTEGG